VEQLNSSLVRDTRELKTYELRYMESQREVVSLQTVLSAKEREADERRQEVMRLEQGVSVKEQELGETRSNVDTLQRQLIVISQEKELYEQRSESFSKRVTQLESELKEIEARYHRSQQDLSSQADQIASLQLKLDQLGQILTESEKSVREKLRASEHRMQNISIQSMDDKSQLEKTHGVLQRQQRLYEEGQDQVFKLSQQNQQLEALVSELEAVRDDLAARLDQASEARRMAEIAAQRLENDMKSLRDLLNLREKELRQVQESFQRDSQEVAYLRKMLNEQTDANQQLTLSLRNKETELSLTSERLISFQRLSEELKASKASEAALHASIDRLEEQLYRAEQDRDRLKQTYENVTRSEQVSQQLLKTMEREKEGLMHTCQKALDENDRLSQSIGFTRAEQQEMYSKVQTFEQRFREQEDLIARYRAHIQSLETEQSTRRPIEEKLTRSGSNKDLVAVYSDLEAERLKIDRLESLLEEQKRVNADLRSDLANAHDSTQTLKKDADPRDQILGLEMEVMRLRDEVGKAKHSQFRSDSKLRDLERRTTSLRAEPEA
jgi:chromosome segregation ATPase